MSSSYFSADQTNMQTSNDPSFDSTSDLYRGTEEGTEPKIIDETYVGKGDDGLPFAKDQGLITLAVLRDEEYGLAVSEEKLIRNQSTIIQTTSLLAVIYPNGETLPAFPVSDVIIQKRDIRISTTGSIPGLPSPEYGVTYALIGLPLYFAEWIKGSVKVTTDYDIGSKKITIHGGRMWINAKIIKDKSKVQYNDRDQIKEAAIRDIIESCDKSPHGDMLLGLRLNRTSNKAGNLPDEWSLSATILVFAFHDEVDESGPLLEKSASMKLSIPVASSALVQKLNRLSIKSKIAQPMSNTPAGGSGIGNKWMGGKGPTSDGKSFSSGSNIDSKEGNAGSQSK